MCRAAEPCVLEAGAEEGMEGLLGSAGCWSKPVVQKGTSAAIVRMHRKKQGDACRKE